MPFLLFPLGPYISPPNTPQLLIMPAVIEIDGAGGNGFMHILGEVDPKKVRFDMKVKAVWKPAKERTGDITDIKYFKPVGKGGK